ENGISPGQTGLQKLVTVEDEVFPQQRRRYGSTDRSEVRELALEEGRVRQNAQASGPMFFVNARDLDRLKIGTEKSGRGGRFFHLGDYLRACRVLQSRTEITDHRRFGEAAFELNVGNAAAGVIDLPSLAGHDGVENGRHG